MISRVFLESETISTRKTNLNPTNFPIMLISNVHEIYVDNPHFLLFQSYNKRYKSVFTLFLAILGLKQFLMHKASLITTNHMNRKKFIKKMCP